MKKLLSIISILVILVVPVWALKNNNNNSLSKTTPSEFEEYLFSDYYAYDLEDHYSDEIESFHFTEEEKDLYYRLRNLYIAVGTGKSDNLVVDYRFKNNVEDINKSLDKMKVFFALNYRYGRYNYWTTTKLWKAYPVAVGNEYCGIRIEMLVAPEFEVAGSEGKKVDVSKTKSAYTKFEQATDEIVEEAKDLNDYEKLTYYADRLSELSDYDFEYVENNGIEYTRFPHTIVSIFDEDPTTLTVCDGFSYAFQLLCDKTTFENDIKVYTIRSNNHAWNIVTMENGLTYHMDISVADVCGENSINYLLGSSLTGNKQIIFFDDNYGNDERVLTEMTVDYIKDLTFAEEAYVLSIS